MSVRGLSLLLATVVATAAGCGMHFRTPRRVVHDARFGYLAGAAPPPPRDAMCRDWSHVVGRRDRRALSHVSFPETEPARACFTPVRYRDHTIELGATPPGCAYPTPAQRESLDTLATGLEQSDALESRLLPCPLTAPLRVLVRAHNARVLRHESERLADPSAPRYPYAAVFAFGYGWPDQADTSIADWRPGDACHPPARGDVARLGAMIQRARRVADALRAGVAPVALVSGGAVHSRMVEAFAMLYLLHCMLGVHADRVLLDPCAQHTHTNLRNAGRWLVAMGARTAYVVTDDGLQGTYLQDYSGFEVVAGSVDQRALRDWHHLVGAWRQAAVGPNVGFWYTPYRFWAEPREGLGSVTCLDGAGP